MIYKLIKSIKLIVDYYIKQKKIFKKMGTCNINNRIKNIIKPCNKKNRKYLMTKAYNLAFWGYNLDTICNELEFSKRMIIK